MGSVELKSGMLKLSREEFRHAVAGLIGLDGMLKRLRHEELVKLREGMTRGFERHDREIAKLRRDMNKLREDVIGGFKRHDEEFIRL